jgi:hypothetical protein
MTVQEFQADATVRAAKSLAHYVLTTEPDKRDWTPTVEGAAPLRSALDMASECIIVNHTFAGILRGEAPPSVSPITAPRAFSTVEEGCEKLVASAEILAAEIRRMTDADLTREYLTRRGPMPGFLVTEVPLRNLHYHCGQINLLQLLHGDAEFQPFRR